MKRTSKILLSTILLAIISVSCLKPAVPYYVRLFCTIDGNEFEYSQNESNVFPKNEQWEAIFHYQNPTDSIARIAFYRFYACKLDLFIFSDTSCFVDGKKYFYEEQDMYPNPNPVNDMYPKQQIKTSWPLLDGKRYCSGSFEFHLVPKDESDDFYYTRVSYYVLFETHWVGDSLSDTTQFNGRIEVSWRTGERDFIK